MENSLPQMMISKTQKHLRNRLKTSLYHQSMPINSISRQLVLLLTLTLVSISANGIDKNNFSFIKFDYVLESIDGLEQLKIFTDTLPLTKKPEKELPTFPDLVYEYKIAAIDKLSPIDFDYNPMVKRYIDIYAIERREQVSQILGLSQLYFPLFDEMLDKYNLPLELKYLAIVESALNPLAVSKSGAVGLWQFKINSARMFNLSVNSYIDERMDPIKSTEAACLYLQYLYKIFNDWSLALAAYNTGPGPVRNAIQRANGETNFWKIYDYLPEAAQNYVPAFIAAAYIMNNAPAHKISIIKPIIDYSKIDTVMVSKPFSFASVAKELDIPIEVIRFLNPTYRRDYFPELDRSLVFWLPSNKIEKFLKGSQNIYNTKIEKASYQEIVANSGNTEGKIKIQYSVQSGDYLHKIAIANGCTIDDLIVWNNINNDTLNVGEFLTIWIDQKHYQKIQQKNSADSLKSRAKKQ